jgi:hypothetical protein
MFNPNQPCKDELVDFDEESINRDSIRDLGGSGSNNNGCPRPPPPPPPPTLPSGQIIDGKNTLQSFDAFIGDQGEVIATYPNTRNTNMTTAKDTRTVFATTTNRANAATATSFAARQDPLILPNGEIINAKNINQSYDVADHRISNKPVHVNSPSNSGTDNAIVSNNNDSDTTYNVPTVLAFAVPSIVSVEAEPISTSPQEPQQQQPPQQRPPQQRTTPFWYVSSFIVTALVAVATGLGVYCGRGNCKSNIGGSPTFPISGTPTFPSNVAPTFPVNSDGTPTPSPTHNGPTTILLEFINNITLSNQNITVNGASPESQALTWMVQNESLFNFSYLNSMADNIVSFIVCKRYPLLVMWFQQTEALQWTNTTGWLVDPNECTWYGISCQTMDLGGSVGIQNVVTGIDFFNSVDNNYVGTIPADLGLLSWLQHFDLSESTISGTLPESIGKWTALTFFSLSGNALTGTLPEAIGQWTALEAFGVYRNSLAGTVPESIGNWSQIREAYFWDNDFTGTIPIAICNYIQSGDGLWADCLSEINCTCCTTCL